MLTNPKVKNAVIKNKPYKLYDGDYLFLLVNPNGSKYWRYKFKFNGKEKTFSIGVYPKVTIKQARAKRDWAKKLIDNNENPIGYEKRKELERIKKSQNTFEYIARLWFEKESPVWSEKHKQEVMNSFERDLFPHLGKTAVDDIDFHMLLEVLRKIEKRGALVIVRKVRQRCESIFSFAVVEGKAKYNPAVPLRKAKFQKRKEKNYRKLNHKDIPKLMDAINDYTQGEPTTRLGLKFIVYTFMRTKELRFLEWSDIDWNNNLITIPAERMKMGRKFLIPFSTQCLEILKELKPLTGHYKYVFASYHKPKTQPMSENAMLNMLRNIGFHDKTTVHGLRATASTALNELGYNPDHIEAQLAHSQGNQIRATYNHAEYLPQRRKLLQDWADTVDNLGVNTGNILPISNILK